MAASLNHTDILGQKFSAAGTIRLPRTRSEYKNFNATAIRLALESEGWLVESNIQWLELGAGSFGMFSGRWDAADVEALTALAQSGFEGTIDVEGEEIAVAYALSAGVVSAVARPIEHPEDSASPLAAAR